MDLIRLYLACLWSALPRLLWDWLPAIIAALAAAGLWAYLLFS